MTAHLGFAQANIADQWLIGDLDRLPPSSIAAANLIMLIIGSCSPDCGRS
jgi:hypothetical protein